MAKALRRNFSEAGARPRPAKGIAFAITAAVSAVVMIFVCQAQTPSVTDPGAVRTVVEGNNIFAFNLYSRLKDGEGNLFFSPFGISSSMAMTYGGARGNTAAQMADVLRFGFDRERIHPVFSELMRSLTAGSKQGECRLSLANALWCQSGYGLRREFADLTKTHYEAGLREVDFTGNAEATRRKINAWVEGRTDKRIKELVAPGAIDAMTRLLLTNAVCFKGAWARQFDKARTHKTLFALADGNSVEAQMMNQKRGFRYAEDDRLQILELPYAGDRLSMLVLLPKERLNIRGIEGFLTQEQLERWVALLKEQEVEVFIPRFNINCSFVLNGALKALGMTDAFSEKFADFSGIAADPAGLFISKVLHEAFAEVSERGTDAAAGAAVVMNIKAAPPQQAAVFRADAPFIFIIRDVRSGSILFIGRLMNPVLQGD